MPADGDLPNLRCLAAQPARSGDDLAAAARTLTVETLGAVQAWLADERFAATRLVVVTRVRVPATGPVTDPAAAAVWGLLRSAQTENPGRIVLVDLDADDRSWPVLGAALRLDEPQFALRAGAVLAPRLVTAQPGLTVPDGVAPWRLVPGADGALSSLGFVDVPEVVCRAGRRRGADRGARRRRELPRRADRARACIPNRRP